MSFLSILYSLYIVYHNATVAYSVFLFTLIVSLLHMLHVLQATNPNHHPIVSTSCYSL